MSALIRQRTCRACRKKKDKKELLRLIILDKKIVEADPGQIRPGRGWYLCQEETCLSCLKAAKSRHKSFGRDLEIGPKLKNTLTIPPAGGAHGQN
jgi:predicted RNA-binding protein YlxR (DUF448 family)